MKIVAGRIAFDRRPRLAGIGRAIDGRVHYVNRIGVFRIGGDFLEIPAASPETFVSGNLSPGCTSIFRAKYASEFLDL